MKSTKSNQASLNDLPISESNNKLDTSGLELVIPAQPPSRPQSPGQSALRPKSQKQTHPNPPIAPPAVPPGVQPSGSSLEPAIHETPQPKYSLCPTK